MLFEITRNYELVRRIMIEPHNWRAGSDDFSPSAADFDPLRHLDYISVYDGGELLGLFVLLWHSPVLVEIHTRLMPIARGRARAALSEMLAWIWEHTGAHRIVTSIVQGNRLAFQLGRYTGFTEYGFNEASCRKGGRLLGQHLLGITRPLTNSSQKEAIICH